MKSKYLLILTIIIISCLSIGLVSANDNADNETVILQNDNLNVEILEKEFKQEELETTQTEDEMLAGSTIGPNGPPIKGNTLTDLQNIVRNGGVIWLNNDFSYQEGDPTEGIEIKNNAMIYSENNVTIDGGNVAKLFVISNGTSLYISGLNFVNAKTNDNGAALDFEGNSLYIEDCSFVNCSAVNGGAVHYDGLSLVVNNTLFKDNHASTQAAAMHITASSTLISDCSFSNNRAEDKAGAIFWQQTSRDIGSLINIGDNPQNSTTYAGSERSIAIGMYVAVLSSYSMAWGQFINITNSSSTLSFGQYNNIKNSYGSTVIGNNINISDSPASSCLNEMHIKNGEFAIINSKFSKNTAVSNGGAIVTTTGVTSIYNSTFENCEAKFGGALYSFDVNVYNSNFTKNNANSQGGVMYFVGGANVYDSSFVKNTADFQGGAVFSAKATKPVNFYKSLFDGNGLKNREGNYYGGAIFEADLIRLCTFINNHAWSGGAVYQWHHHSSNRIRIENSTFNNNTAIGTGGAVYAHYGGNILFSNFTNNRAGDVGGGVGGWNHISENCLFINNSAKVGGALGGESSRAYGNLIINSTATQLAGAIYGWNLIIRDNIIINSTSNDLGGAIGTHEYLQSATSTFTNNTIINATAKKGGTFYLYNYVVGVKSVLTLNKIYNSSADIGGAIYSHSITTLTNNIFENTDADSGGVVYSDFELTVKNNTVTGSRANQGRDIYNDGKISISYLTFNDGKTIFADYRDVLLIHANLTDDMGNTITGQNISFVINGETYSVKVIEGVASFNYTVDFIRGEQLVNGSYDGSASENTVMTPSLIKINSPILSIVKNLEHGVYYDGDTVIYTVVVNNTGRGKAVNVYVRDDLSEGLELINTTSNKGNLIDNIWMIDELGIGEVVIVHYKCLLTLDGSIKNEAIVGCENGDENSSNVTINVRPYQPHVKVEKITLTPIVIVGQNALFEIVLNNTDRMSLKDVKITEDSFDGLVFDSYQESPLWTHSIVNGKHVWTLMTDLAPREVVSLFVSFKTTELGNFTNEIVVNSTVLENKTANSSVIVLYPHLDAKKVSLMPITKVGNQTLFEIVVFNDGEFDVHNLFIIEDFFDGLTYSHYLIDDLWSHSIVDGKHKWTMVEELAPGETIGLFVYFDTEEIGNFTNYAIVGSDETMSKTVNATVWVNETVHMPEGSNPKLDVKVTALHPLVVAGGQIKFEVIVTNSGDVILNDVSISEDSFEGLVFDHIEDHTGIWQQIGSVTSNGLLAANELSWRMNMPLYTSETLGFFMMFNTTAPGTFTNSIIGSSDKTEPQKASDDVEVVVPQYTIEKVALNKTVNVGDKVYFEVIVKNTGRVNITNLVIIEMPDEGLTYDSFIDSQGFWNEGADFAWNLNTVIVPGETVTFFVIYTAEKVANLTNTIVSEDKIANATVEVLNKSNNDVSNPGTGSNSNNSTTDVNISYGSTSGEATSTEDIDKDTSDNQSANGGSAGTGKNAELSTNVGNNATGHPLIALLSSLLILVFRRRDEK